MNNNLVALVMLVMLVSGFNIGSYLGKKEFDDMHCQPIKKVQTLEEAKALIDGYHAKAKVGG